MTDQKQMMQNTIKNLQNKTDLISKLEDKGSKVVVLQLGSSSIKMGFANQKTPFTLSPYIAYKRNYPLVPQKYDQKMNQQMFSNEYIKIENTLKAEGVIQSQHRPFKGKPRAKQVISLPQLSEYYQADMLYGVDALWAQQNANYIFRKPIQHGLLNISRQGEQRQCIKDIVNLVDHIMRDKMKIPREQWRKFSCILILPDVFIRQHIKMLLNQFFLQIGFTKLYVHLESVMACFGTAVSSACVVDIGHEKINVCCVDEGIILPKTLVRKNYGSKHVSKTILKLLQDKHPQFSINNQKDIKQFDYLKENTSAIRQPQQTYNKIYQLYQINGKKQTPIQIPFADYFCVASNSIFSGLWNCFQEKGSQYLDPTSKLYDLSEDPDDYFQEFSAGGLIYQIGGDDICYTEQTIDPFVYQSLTELVFTSLMAVRDPQNRNKFISNILIIGGGCYPSKLSEVLISSLANKLKAEPSCRNFRPQLSTDLFLRQIAPIYASWQGGTVIPKLDSLRDLWIERNKYLGTTHNNEEDEQEQIIDKKLFTRKQQSQEWGIRYLKQKVPFLW